MKKFFAEFKEFAMKGNVLDMAVGVIIGAAFKAIVDSLVADIISPLLGLLFKSNFDNLAIQIPNTEVVIGYGKFITAVINFIIMAFVIFCIIKAINKVTNLVKKDEEVVEEATTKECPYCKSEIAIEATRCPHCTSEVE
ncbi:MAG: large conductance mechanosensitive channel protein MscL [Clostridia bacterium]|nr:large conductance mechanosensitive channel protein MscL [Clostridia bacterium]